MSDCVFVSCPIMNVSTDGDYIPVMQDASKESPALGVYTLAAILSSENIDCEIIDWVAEPSRRIDEIASDIAQYEVAFFSANSMNWGIVNYVALLCRKKNEHIKICLGGPHATHFPESVISSGVFDAFFRGDADQYISDVYIALKSKKRKSREIPGFGLCDGSEIPDIWYEKSIDDLNILPLWDRLPRKVYKAIPVETSRGCKFQCAFCSITSMKNWRGRATQIALERLEHAYSYIHKINTGVVSIIDDTFTTDHGRIEQLCGLLDTERFKGRLNYDATVVDMRNELIVEQLLPFTNNLLLGAEVATKKDAKRIRKAATPELIEQAASTLHKYGSARKAVFSFIIGFPWHTKKDCLDVVNFVQRLILEYGIKAYVQWYWPMPGSAIWRDLKCKGKVDLLMLDEPGFFLTEKWFYGVRNLTREDVSYIDERINLAKMLVNMSTHGEQGNSFEYSTPRIRESEWESRRSAFL